LHQMPINIFAHVIVVLSQNCLMGESNLVRVNNNPYMCNKSND